MSRYELLHYRGDVMDDIPDGAILGCDEMGRPYAVIDAEYHEADGIGCTTVHLKHATAEQITAAIQAAG